jgi:hypothetical protein
MLRTAAAACQCRSGPAARAAGRPCRPGWRPSSAPAARPAPSGFGRSHGQGLAELGSGVAKVVAERLAVQPDLAGLPERRDVEVPPTSVISSLRCPPLEEVVQRYHAERSAVLQVGGAAARRGLRCALARCPPLVGAVGRRGCSPAAHRRHHPLTTRCRREAATRARCSTC